MCSILDAVLGKIPIFQWDPSFTEAFEAFGSLALCKPFHLLSGFYAQKYAEIIESLQIGMAGVGALHQDDGCRQNEDRLAEILVTAQERTVPCLFPFTQGQEHLRQPFTIHVPSRLSQSGSRSLLGAQKEVICVDDRALQ